MLELPDRKPIRLAAENYLGQNFYFVTICCVHWQAAFRDANLAGWVLNLLHTESAADSFRIHAFCLMPDHLHFLAEGIEPSSDLLHFVKSFRIKSSRHYSEVTGGVLWQKRYYDHILRDAKTVEAVAWYIRLNPVRKGLVAKAEEYPFVGSCTGKEMPTAWGAADWCPPWKKDRCPHF